MIKCDWRSMFEAIGVVMLCVVPSQVRAEDCTFALVKLTASVPEFSELASDVSCDATQELQRNELGTFGSSLRLCLRRASKEAFVLSVNSEDGRRVGEATIIQEYGNNQPASRIIDIFDPSKSGDVPRSRLRIEPRATVSDSNEIRLTVEAIEIQESECIVEQRVVFRKTEPTNVHDEFNVRTQNVEESYK